ncbi:MAG: flagellin [Sphingomonadales bacterium 32-68-7]|nr:MAG: flagellin [Sphingomonadales bacterium 12-68-11]OYX10165.1 MAG: flagellin [Sphingomonadales bacterium 32-68-7]
MLSSTDPHDAYHRVEFDARVKSASPAELVHICYDQLILSLSTALLAEQRQDSRLKSRSITRALTALMALQLGIDREHAMADLLSDFYGAAQRSILASSVKFDRECLIRIRDDFMELRAAFQL